MKKKTCVGEGGEAEQVRQIGPRRVQQLRSGAALLVSLGQDPTASVRAMQQWP